MVISISKAWRGPHGSALLLAKSGHILMRSVLRNQDVSSFLLQCADRHELLSVSSMLLAPQHKDSTDAAQRHLCSAKLPAFALPSKLAVIEPGRTTATKKKRAVALALQVSSPLRLVPGRPHLARFSSNSPAAPPSVTTQQAVFMDQLGDESHRSHACAQLSRLHVGEEVSLFGWLQSSRAMGGMFFGVLRDKSGPVQVILEREAAAKKGKLDLFDKLCAVPLESVMWLKGTVALRAEGEAKPDQVTGEIEIRLDQATLLNSSAPPPIRIKGDYTEDTRLRWRFLDMRRASVQRTLQLRSEVARQTRNFLHNEGFQEIETPLLFKSTPEGASEFLVPTRVKGKAYALPQSPQQYKQLLMAGGVEKYFQIAKCFRDEGMRSDRQPEFTQIDLEASFVRERDIQQVVEATAKYGVDKPDLRYGFCVRDITSIVKKVNAPLFDAHSVIKAICGKGLGSLLSRRDVRKLKEWGLLAIVEDPSRDWQLPPSAFTLSVVRQEICKELDASSGDLILIRGGQEPTISDAMGRARIQLADFMFSKGLLDVPGVTKAEEAISSSRFNFTWVVNFPLFEFGPGGLSATHHPFTSPKPEHAQALRQAIHVLVQEPSKQSAQSLYAARESLRGVLAQHYDLVCNGVELGGGSIRVHDAELQSSLLRLLGSDSSQFGHLIECLSYGCPPHGGMALGLDRLVALMGAPSNQMYGLPLREVIPFPKSTTGADLLTKSPALVPDEQWAQYHLTTK
eukprot:g34223.t1